MLPVLTLGLYLCFLSTGACSSHEPQVDCNTYKKLPERATPLRCTLEYFPICGSNGQTYTNKCLFCNAVMASQMKIQFKHYGAC